MVTTVPTKRTEPPGWVSSIMKGIARVMSPHLSRIDELERRLSELEGRKAFSYKGMWRDGIRAMPGEFYTRNGSIWHCSRPTTTAPGTDREAWTLAVKKGRDGRTGGSQDD